MQAIACARRKTSKSNFNTKKIAYINIGAAICRPYETRADDLGSIFGETLFLANQVWRARSFRLFVLVWHERLEGCAGKVGSYWPVL
jgi:hypothetical protein